MKTITLIVNNILLDVTYLIKGKNITILIINHNRENIISLINSETVIEIMKILKIQVKAQLSEAIK
jgi:hypothetical protein